MAVPIYISDFLGRRVDILGRVQQVKDASAFAGVATAIFKAGGTLFPSTAGTSQPTVQGRCFVAFVTIEGYSGTAPIGATNMSLGSAGSNYIDFSSGGFDPYYTAGLPLYAPGPVVIPQNYMGSSIPPIVYSAGTVFGVRMAPGNSSNANDSLTFTAYGWAY